MRQFLANTWNQFSKSKSDYEFASLINFYARYARSRRKDQHVIYYLFEATILKSGFSESLDATFLCVARRHSLTRSPMSKKKDTLTMIDLGGTASGIGLIPRQITLKDNEFDQFIQNISLSKTTMSKDQDLVSLTMSILDKPPRSYKLDKDGVFKEDQEQINTWEEYFKLFDNPKGLEDFMADREQDIPKDRN